MLSKQYLTKEYITAKKELSRLTEESSNLTKGTIQRKVISGKEYYYLAFRKDGKVQTKYIKAEDLERMADETMRRKGIDMNIKSLRKEIKTIEEVLGRETTNIEYLKQISTEVVNNNPEYNIKKLTLFGSRANGSFRDDSDADILVEFKEGFKPTLMTLSGLRLKLIDALGYDVDLIKYPLPKGSILEIGDTEILYGT